MIGTGSEVAVCVDAAGLLADQGITSGSCRCRRGICSRCRTTGTRTSCCRPELPTLAVEAGASLGWDRWSDDSLSLDRFGASAPGAVALANLGYTPDNVADRARQLVRDLQEDDG